MTIIKLPAHTTDLLQPLDVSVFKSLKDLWGKALFSRLKLTSTRLSMSEFSKFLVSSAVWSNAFTENNIINEFEKCSIYPVTHEKYLTERFNVNLKECYNVYGFLKESLTGQQLF